VRSTREASQKQKRSSKRKRETLDPNASLRKLAAEAICQETTYKDSAIYGVRGRPFLVNALA
jgi:hypothetical protein